ncbi:MAG: inorganic diphosphatase [Haliea sp.]|mgnify:CR=1 FL=1|jgi:inorganic pyrophosphatase|nr:inorganic diphosphatase [Haliea sp.]
MPKSFVMLLLVLALPVLADGTGPAEDRLVRNVLYFPQPDNAPAEVYALVEIPAGSTTKYELDAATGHLLVDRFQSMPVVYPANYGTLPSTLAGDNDPLDVLVYTREPVVPGALILVRPIGMLKMLDGGEQDDKLIAVPADAVEPTYAAVRDISDLPEIELQRLQAFFSVYKQLPVGRKQVELQGVGDRAAALEVTRAALLQFSAVAEQ